MKTRGLRLILIGIFLAFTAAAQSQDKQVTHQQLVWFAYNNTLKFDSKWSLTSEVHERRFINPSRQHQFVLRSQVRYALGENWVASAGFTYFLQSPNDPNATKRLTVPELRPHIEFNYRQSIGKLGIAHRYRAEKRFFRNTANGELATGYNTNYRFRYRLAFEYHLTDIKSRPFKLKVYDEIHVNAGENIVYNRFDQNRIYAGLQYAVSKSIDVEAGYLNWYQQRSSGNEFYNRHILSMAINHNIDLEGKKNSK